MNWLMTQTQTAKATAADSEDPAR